MQDGELRQAKLRISKKKVKNESMVIKKLTTESFGRDGEDCPGRLPARETKITRRLRENSRMVRKKWWQSLTKGLFRDPFGLGLVGGGEAFVQAMHCPLCCNRERTERSY